MSRVWHEGKNGKVKGLDHTFTATGASAAGPLISHKDHQQVREERVLPLLLPLTPSHRQALQWGGAKRHAISEYPATNTRRQQDTSNARRHGCPAPQHAQSP